MKTSMSSFYEDYFNMNSYHYAS